MPYPLLFVGAGPGNAELITRAGWQALAAAEVVLFDALLDVTGFRHAAPQAEWIAVGKRGRVDPVLERSPAAVPTTSQPLINGLLLTLVKEGRRVVRLKGGDPGIFGRLAEEIAALRDAGLSFRIIPGVTAAAAAAAELGLSLTARGVVRSLALVTAAASDPDPGWADAVVAADAAVIYMGGHRRSALAQLLLDKGMAGTTAVAVVENASGPGLRQLTTLGDLATSPQSALAGPVCLIVGESVGESVGGSVGAHHLAAPSFKAAATAPDAPAPQALLLLAHGSRSERWRDSFAPLQRRLAELWAAGPVELAFLEHGGPLLEAVVQQLITAGVWRLRVEPLIMASGFHIEEDLPHRLALLKTQFPGLSFEVGGAMLDDAVICEAMCQRLATKLPPLPAAPTAPDAAVIPSTPDWFGDRVIAGGLA